MMHTVQLDRGDQRQGAQEQNFSQEPLQADKFTSCIKLTHVRRAALQTVLWAKQNTSERR